MADIVIDTLIVLGQLGVPGVVQNLGVQGVGVGEVPVAGVYRHPEGVRVGLEQGDLPGAEAIAILVEIVAGDGEQRLFTRVGVGVGRARPVPAHALRQADDSAGPLGNQPVGIGGANGAHRGEILAQARHVLL